MDEPKELVPAKIQWWLVILLIAPSLLSVVFLIWPITIPAILAFQRNEPMRDGWNIPLVLFWDVVISATCIYLLWIGVREIATTVTDEYIERTIWFYRKRILWKDVIRIDKSYQVTDWHLSYSGKIETTSKPVNIRIISDHKGLELNLHFYRNKEFLLEQLERKVAEAKTH